MDIHAFFGRFPEFVHDAGGWGITSGVAAFAAFGLSVYEHKNGEPVTSFTLLAISVVLFWLGAYIAWLKKYRVVEDLERRPNAPVLLLQYSSNVPNALHCSGFSIRTENEREAFNVRIGSGETVGDNHVKLGMKWESPGHAVGRTPVLVNVRCVYQKDGQFCTYNSVAADQINLFFDHQKNRPRELTVTLEYTDVEGRACPARKFRLSQDIWNNRKISCEPIQT